MDPYIQSTRSYLAGLGLNYWINLHFSQSDCQTSRVSYRL
jgi:hypothetical protein